MLAAFERIQLEQKDLRKRIRELDTRRLELDADPSVAIPEPGRDAHVNDAAEFERGVIDDALRAYKRVLVGLGNKGPMQVLCDESVLPNYAFPEPGVTLKSVLRGSHEAPVEHSSAAAQGKDDAGDAKGAARRCASSTCGRRSRRCASLHPSTRSTRRGTRSKSTRLTWAARSTRWCTRGASARAATTACSCRTTTTSSRRVHGAARRAGPTPGSFA
jgi:hypothetical protein